MADAMKGPRHVAPGWRDQSGEAVGDPWVEPGLKEPLSLKEHGEKHYSSRGIGRVVAVLRYLGDHPGSSLPNLSTGVRLAKPTVLRFLRSLVEQGFAAKAGNGGYRLGPDLVYLCLREANMFNLNTVALPVMRHLAEETGETVGLSIVVGPWRVLISQVESRQLTRRVGELNRSMPLHAGATGKALLAWSPPERIAELTNKARLERFTKATVTEPKRLLAQLEKIRIVGYAISLGEYSEDAAAISAPIRGAPGTMVVGAISVFAPAHRTSERQLIGWAPAVKRAALEIAQRLGAIVAAV